MRGKANLASRLLCVVFLLMFSRTAAAGSINYGGGSGTAEDPYLIYTAEQMNTIGTKTRDWNKHFKLMTDIDLSSFGTAFSIIGTSGGSPFSGVFNGDGHSISNFECGAPDVYGIGLFGYVNGQNAEIKNLRLIDPVIHAETEDYVGPLIGRIHSGTVTACSVEGGFVSGNESVGGLVGSNSNLGLITQCYSTATVSGATEVGGLVGKNYGKSTNCYSSGSVSGNEIVGGLVGRANPDSITHCYSTARVSGTKSVGGLVGNTNRVKWSFWDIETSGQAESGGGTGKTTAEMQTASTFIGYWGGDPVWTIDEGADYPRLAWQNMPGELIIKPSYAEGSGTEADPYLIYTAEQLNMIGLFPCDWDKHFKLTADIDLSKYTGTEFNIIGYRIGVISYDNEPFTGVFDGNGRTISNFNYSSTEWELYIGIFGYTERATLENIYLIDPNINVERGQYVGSLVGWSQYGSIVACYVQGGNVWGASEVGGLVGNNHGTITECTSLTAVMGGSRIGGLVGYNYYGGIGHCYSLSNVTGTTSVGGLVGTCGSQATIVHCYSAGSVQGTENVGGLLGSNGQGEILYCFWDIETSGQLDSAGGEGKTTADMQTASTFIGWGSYAIWTINEGLEYPRLLWEDISGELITTPSFPWIQGSGTQDDPYLIYTADQFNQIGLFPPEWDKHYKLMADIDLSTYSGTTFNIIGRYVRYPSSGYKAFSGVFNGNGHTISNFNYSGSSGGIFGRVEDAEIKDLGFIDPNVSLNDGGDRVGVLAGWLLNSTITNCYVQGGSVSGRGIVGGLVGDNYGSTIINSYFQGSVFGSSGVGGLVGWNRGIITNCHFSGEVSGTGRKVGGLAGDNSGSINDCSASAHVSGINEVGGLVGEQWSGRIMDCYTAGSVSGEEQIGGLIGRNNGVITNCYTTSEVSGATYVGGFAGRNGFNPSDVVWHGNIYNCYARGNVIGEEYVGGFAGNNDYFGLIYDCYSTGNVLGVEGIGGLVGQNRQGDVIESFWDIETSGLSASAAGEGKTTAQMQDPNVFMSAGWDFAGYLDGPHDIWAEPIEGGYPILWWQLSPLDLLPAFSGGSGEPNNPYLIATAEDLNRIGHNPRLMEAHFKLINDIDLTDIDFFIIGNYEYPFSGVFDGHTNKILNFSCSYEGVDHIGLFGYIRGAEIKDLRLVDPNVDCPAGFRTGALVGWAWGTIRRCEVVGGTIRGSQRVAMLVGESHGLISACFTSGSVIGHTGVGGLVGRNYGTVTDCGTSIHITGSSSTGGLVGSNNNNSLVDSSFADGTVIGNRDNIGGLIGTNGYNAIVTNCYTSGTVTGRNHVGGLVGSNIISSFTWVEQSTLISNCYAQAETEGKSEVGGLVGANDGSVSISYSTGKVAGNLKVGGLVGSNDSGDVANSFWDIQTSGQSTSAGGAGRTTAQMQMAGTFLDAGWDFVDETVNGTEDIWWILEGQDYPRLWWEPTENDLLSSGNMLWLRRVAALYIYNTF